MAGRPDWGTPRDLFNELNDRYKFTLDGAAHQGNHKLPRWHGPGGELEDALKSDWKDERVFLNPPYDAESVYAFIGQALTSKAELVVCLVPAWTDRIWFHEWVLAAIENGWAQVHFIQGRIRFDDPETGKRGAKSPFPCMLLVCYPSTQWLKEDGTIDEESMEWDAPPPGPDRTNPLSVQLPKRGSRSLTAGQEQSRLDMATGD